MKKNKIAIGKRIHDLRTSHNMSMEDLANSLGVAGKSTINEWEKGRSTPNKNNLNSISKLFDVDPNKIIFGSFSNYLDYKIPILLNTRQGINLINALVKYPLYKNEKSTNANEEIENLLNESRNDLLKYLKNYKIDYSTTDDKLLNKITEYYEYNMNNYLDFESQAKSMIYPHQNLLTSKTLDATLLMLDLSGKLHPRKEVTLEEWINNNNGKNISDLINDFYLSKLFLINSEYEKSIKDLIAEEKKSKDKYLK